MIIYLGGFRYEDQADRFTGGMPGMGGMGGMGDMMGGGGGVSIP